MSAAAKAAGEELVVVTSANGLHVADGTVMNFRPIGDFELPEYELQKLSFPPILQILDYVQRERFTEIIISTPGPLGLTGMLAAKMLNLQISAIYHTDFPEYIRILTEDRFLESLAWSYMHWFYGQADTVLVNSEQYRRSWIDRGFSPDKLNILPRGLDLELFDASRRDPKFWDEFGCATADVRLLYVGRLSKEKDLDVIAATYQALKAELPGIALSVVGHGPYAEALQQMLPDACFTGRLEGEKLAVAYASADIFVFPSTTDTFGNVVIEAQASGLPVIVSDIGGPKELVRHGKTGLITKGRDVEDFSNAVRALVTNPQWRKEIGNAARESVVDRSWPTAFRAFWEMTNR
jgi:glycosyltransferase involved in cell wall biosynthesis